jgi:hypothetical protein
MLPTVALLALATVALKGAAAAVPHLPDSLIERTRLLAPGLLAALVVTELTGSDGIPRIDAKAAGVAVALLLAWRRAPLALIVIAGAVVAAAARAAGAP